jgi:hypothetical protein
MVAFLEWRQFWEHFENELDMNCCTVEVLVWRQFGEHFECELDMNCCMVAVLEWRQFGEHLESKLDMNCCMVAVLEWRQFGEHLESKLDMNCCMVAVLEWRQFGEHLESKLDHGPLKLRTKHGGDNSRSLWRNGFQAKCFFRIQRGRKIMQTQKILAQLLSSLRSYSLPKSSTYTVLKSQLLGLQLSRQIISVKI